MRFITTGLVCLVVCETVDASDLLGCALAHLILHSTRDGAGVMRAEELAMAGQRRLVFDLGDTAQLLQRLHGR